jgi:hypothetical protein
MRLWRRTIRYTAAAVAASMALIYFGIGLGVLDVGGSEADQTFLIVFGGLAGGAFLLGALLLVRFDRRWLWVVGAVFQIFVYWAYFNVAKTRTPPFEVWGIALRIIQLPLLAALIYLAVRAPEPTSR